MDLKKKYRYVLLTCGWCRSKFTASLYKNLDEERNILVCPKCTHILNASKKVSTKKSVGRKHIHEEYKDGDTAI